jgi:hypothetical protein
MKLGVAAVWMVLGGAGGALFFVCAPAKALPGWQPEKSFSGETILDREPKRAV